MKKFNLNLKTIFTLGITSLVLVFSLSFYFLLMAAIEDIVKNSLERRLRMTGKLIESILAKYDLTKYKSEEDKDKYHEEYKDILREMRDIKNNVDGIKFIYTAKLVGTNIFYIIDCAENEDERAKIGELYDDAAANMYKILKGSSDKIFIEKDYTTDKYGSFLSSYSPVIKNGSVEYIVGSDIKVQDVEDFFFSYKVKFSYMFLGLTLVIIPIWFKITSRIKASLEEIKKQIIRLRDLDFDNKEHVDTWITDIVEIIDITDKAKVTLETALKNVESESLLLETCLISKADRYGKITYANEKFCKTSGYTLSELIGKDHKIVNSGVHDKEYWRNMYKTVIKEKGLWYDTVTNKNKNGELYYVKSWIKGIFDPKGQFIGFVSVRQDVTEIVKSQIEINKQNTYLEHAAKILRHDMHSGINTYIPRGIGSLERRLKPEVIEQLKLEAPLKMLKEGLTHTQKVYKGVFEFTNLVKPNAKIELKSHDLKKILSEYLSSTAYKDQVIIEDLGVLEVNESLFCTAIDNLIRNGLKYNDSATKYVKIYKDKNLIVIQDNGRGMSQEDFNHLSKPYVRKEGQKESGTGLGLNICIAILKEHKFTILCNKWNNSNGSGTKITLKNE